MAKQSGSDRVTSASSDSHGLLWDLINHLHHLIIVISSKLRHTQIHRSPMGDAKGDYDIWKKLGSHLEQVPVIEKHAVKSHAIRRGAFKGQNQPKNTVKNEPLPVGSELNELHEHNKRKAVHKHQPRIAEQLRSKTMEHINIALILAAEGNRDGVKLHIDLANSAMQTASRFMGHEEYNIFEEKVENRVKSIIDNDRHDDSVA